MNIRYSQFNHKMKLKIMGENLVFKSFMYKEPSVLTLCPMAGKRRLHHNGGCTRLPAMMIVAGIQACHRVTSVVGRYLPVYEALCV